MAFLATGLGKQVLANITTTCAQSLTPSKNDMKFLSGFVRENTRKHWKMALAVAAVGTIGYGAYHLRTEMVKQDADRRVAPTLHEARRLAHTAYLASGNCEPDLDVEALDDLADDMFEELLEFEDYLENDPAPSSERKWQDTDGLIEVAEMSEKLIRSSTDVSELIATGGLPDHSDSGPSVKSGIKAASAGQIETISKVVAIKQQKIDYEQYRRQRKRVRSGQLSRACKSLAAKLRASFPIPDGSALQQKAMCLYAAKECRKLHLRESQISLIIPQAVSLASVPSTDQINMRMITKIEPVQLKYNKMSWSGYQSKSTWLAKLTSMLA
jgi:hypothetical protein